MLYGRLPDPSVKGHVRPVMLCHLAKGQPARFSPPCCLRLGMPVRFTCDLSRPCDPAEMFVDWYNTCLPHMSLTGPGRRPLPCLRKKDAAAGPAVRDAESGERYRTSAHS